MPNEVNGAVVSQACGIDCDSQGGVWRMDDFELAHGIAREVADAGGRVYYVGGFVRDRLLGRENKDVDIEVHGVETEALEQILAQFGAVATYGASFGIYGIRGHGLDIAVPRREDATGKGGHRDFRVHTDPFLGTRKAAMRRDLTMNALYEDVLTGQVIDHFGGQEDMARGVIRHVNDASFTEDPLRVLRAAEFAARFGMHVDASTVELCSSMDLSKLPRERVLEEVKKALLKSPTPSVFFEELRTMNQLDHWFPELLALVDVPQNPKYHPEGDAWAHTMQVIDSAATLRSQAQHGFAFMLAALCHDLGKAVTTWERDGRIVSYGHERKGVPIAAAFLNRVVASPKVKAYVLNMVELHMSPNAFAGQGAKQKAYNKLFDASCCAGDLLLLAKADRMGRVPDDVYRETELELRARLQAYENVMARPHVQGSDLLEAGIEPGPLMGETLRYAHKLQLAGVQKEDALRQCLSFYRKVTK
ncbi:MAG: tRNA nucleotidyltransferase [Eggerthellaceae bacterium]|nr:tRNA nucleotidyltransferase [Eggerthellaceae bacterium]